MGGVSWYLRGRGGALLGSLAFLGKVRWGLRRVPVGFKEVRWGSVEKSVSINRQSLNRDQNEKNGLYFDILVSIFKKYVSNG